MIDDGELSEEDIHDAIREAIDLLAEFVVAYERDDPAFDRKTHLAGLAELIGIRADTIRAEDDAERRRLRPTNDE